MSRLVEVIVAPGTIAVMTVPPTDPTLGEIDTNRGAISRGALTIEWFFGRPTAKKS